LWTTWVFFIFWPTQLDRGDRANGHVVSLFHFSMSVLHSKKILNSAQIFIFCFECLNVLVLDPWFSVDFHNIYDEWLVCFAIIKLLIKRSLKSPEQGNK
jgi:hypothetical protein